MPWIMYVGNNIFMKVFPKARECPCCHEPFTLSEYTKQIQAKPGHDISETFHIQCARCNNIIISKRERSTWSGIVSMIAFLLAIIVLWYLYPAIDYLSFAGAAIVITWTIAISLVPYCRAKLKCYTDKEIKDIDQESEMHLGILLVFILVFFLSIFVIFYYLTQEHKYGQYDKIEKQDVKKVKGKYGGIY